MTDPLRQPESPAPSAPAVPRSRDWQPWLVLILAAIIIFPRSMMISRQTSIMGDDDRHLRRGMLYLTGRKIDLSLTDPVFGEALTTIPMWLAGCDPAKPINLATDYGTAHLPELNYDTPAVREVRTLRPNVLFGERLEPQTILDLIAMWRSLLYLPLVMLAFCWMRAIYGAPAGWAASALLTFDPTIVGFLHAVNTDVLGMEGIGFACWLGWRWFAKPTRWRIVLAALGTGIAMQLKHTAFVLPFILAAYGFAWWLRRRRDRSADTSAALQPADPWLRPIPSICLALLVCFFTVWAADRFDVSAPREHDLGIVLRPKTTSFGPVYRFFDDLTVQPMPAGMYVSSVVAAHNAMVEGHWNYFLGEHRNHGWWYYFPLLMLYKVPLGTLGLMALALLSLFWLRPRFAELSILLPALILGYFVASSSMNYGFRHFLPPYLFLMLLATRALAPVSAMTAKSFRRAIAIVAWLFIGASVVHSIAFYPDYVAYLNYPRKDVWKDISESNMDYGQYLVAVRQWIDAGGHMSNGRSARGRPIYLRYTEEKTHSPAVYWLGDRCIILALYSPRPTRGVLIISPVALVGVYDSLDLFKDLRQFEPVAEIGHAAFVYDLDDLFAHGFKWTNSKPREPT